MSAETTLPYFHYVKRSNPSALWRTFFALRISEIENMSFSEKKDIHAEIRRLFSDQIDIINSFHQAYHIHALEYRFQVIPTEKNRIFEDIHIFLIVSTDHAQKSESLKLARQNFQNILSLYQSFFHIYSLEPVTDKSLFLKIFHIEAEFTIFKEIRRRVLRYGQESLAPNAANKLTILPQKKSERTRRPKHENIYFVHPFIPVYSSYATLFKILTRLKKPVFISIRVTPTTVSQKENNYFLEAIKKCEKIYYSKDATFNLDKEQAEILVKILLSNYLSLQDAPFLLTVFVGLADEKFGGIIDALGTEITAPIGGFNNVLPGERLELLAGYAGGYDVVSAKTKSQQKKFINTIKFHDTHLMQSLLAEYDEEKRLQFLVDASEAANAFHLPICINGDLKGINLRWTKVAPIPSNLLDVKESAKRSGLIGINNYLGLKTPFYLPEETRRRHVYIVGQTGTGKSSILKSMILDDIESGKGVGVFDPHGDLIDYILSNIPKERLDEVILIDPAEEKYAVGVNILENDGPQQQNFIIQELIAMIKRIYDPHNEGITGPIFEDISRTSLLAVMNYSDDTPSFFEFPFFLYKLRFRKYVIKKLKENARRKYINPFVEEELYNLYSSREFHDTILYVISKYGRIVNDLYLRHTLCQKKSTISFDDILNKKRILLVNLNKSKIGMMSSEWLGMFLLTKIQIAAMKRINIDESKRTDFYLYIDEFQNSATDNFVEILAESRKYHLNLTLANQYVSQIPAKISQAVIGNVGTIISLRIGHGDAEMLANQFEPIFNVSDLIGLPNWKGVVTTTATGHRLPPFSINTIPFEENRFKSKKQLKLLKRELIKRWGVEKKEVEKFIKNRIAELTAKLSDEQI